MPRKCFVPWCFSGYDSEYKVNKVEHRRNKAVFQAPKDPEFRRKWHDAIGRTNRVLSETDSVCELHFAESDIQRFYETLMPDGNIHRIPRRCSLKPGAIPDMRILKDFSTDSDSKRNIIESQHILVLRATDDTPEKIAEKNRVNVAVSATQVHCIEVDPLNVVEEKVIALQPCRSSDDLMREKSVYTIANLRIDLKNICLPEGWAYVCFNEGIRFPCWNLKADITMMLTVKNDMTGKVSVPEGLTIETDILNLTSFEEFTKSLILLRKVIFCEGSDISNRRAESCPVIMHYPPQFSGGVRSKRCLPCRIIRKQELNADRKQENTRKNRIIEYQKSLRVIKRQNVRFQTKIRELQTTLDITKKTVPLVKKMTKEESTVYVRTVKEIKKHI